MKIGSDIRLARYSSWRVGGNAEHLIEPKTIEEVKDAAEWARHNGKKLTVLGGGTNLLISDEGVRGLVLSTRKLTGLSSMVQEDKFKVEALAGTSKLLVMKEFLKHELAPALFLAGIPGDIGGGVVMNAGVGEQITPREFVEVIDWIEVLQKGELKHLKNEELEWSYRHCRGWEPGVIVRVGLVWPMEPIPGLAEKVKEANDIRFSKQPLDKPSCGSVFVNPPGEKAAKLIQDSGLKGFSLGGAQVSEKHGNFIINTGEATARDIDSLIKQVQEAVKTKTGVQLETEVIHFGEWA